MDIGPPELILILVAVLVLFGGAQLPKLAKNLGKAQREFKSAMEGGLKGDDPKDDEHKDVATGDTASTQDEPSTPN